MNIGIASIYSWRPHVEHLIYLARLLESAGHRVFGLTCDASVATCYSNLLRGHSRLRGCPGCIAGGLRSYPLPTVDALSSRRRVELDPEIRRELAASSSYTLHRIETGADAELPEVLATQDRFAGAIETVVGSAAAWIESRRLDAVLCFNGRMELPRAVTHACELAGIPFVTVERTWFGHGLHLVPNGDCLALREPVRIAGLYRDAPLTRAQARLAGHLIAARFLKQNVLEWRLYHPDAVAADWPTRGDGPRVLVLPNSNNELYASADWRCAFSADVTVGIDMVLDRLAVPAESVVVRGHPNWSEKIGIRDGLLSARHYEAWAKRRGLFIYRAEDQVNTYELMRQADLVVVTGGSSGAEAAALGKPVVSVTPSPYRESGIAQHVLSPAEVETLTIPPSDPRRIVTRTLRYFYSSAARFPQYVGQVRALTTTRYAYHAGGDPRRLLEIFASGRITADDPETGEDDGGESEVVDRILAGEWSRLHGSRREPRTSTASVDRRLLLRWIDGVRELLPRGDR